MKQIVSFGVVLCCIISLSFVANAEASYMSIGSLSPLVSPQEFPLEQHLTVFSQEHGWSLLVVAHNDFISRETGQILPIDRLEYSVNGQAWRPLSTGGLTTIVSNGQPTGEDGSHISIKYRMNVTWEDSPDTYRGDVKYSLTGRGHFVSSYLEGNPLILPNGSIVIHYYISSDTQVVLQINDDSTTLYEQVEIGKRGWNRVEWSGIDSQGYYVPNGRYAYRISSKDTGELVAQGWLTVEANSLGFVAAAMGRTTTEVHQSSHRLRVRIQPHTIETSVGEIIPVTVVVENMTDHVIRDCEVELDLGGSLVPINTEPEALKKGTFLTWYFETLEPNGKAEIRLNVLARLTNQKTQIIHARAKGDTDDRYYEVEAPVRFVTDSFFNDGFIIGRIHNESERAVDLESVSLIVSGLKSIHVAKDGSFQTRVPAGTYLLIIDDHKLPPGVIAYPRYVKLDVKPGLGEQVDISLVEGQREDAGFTRLHLGWVGGRPRVSADVIGDFGFGDLSMTANLSINEQPPIYGQPQLKIWSEDVLLEYGRHIYPWSPIPNVGNSFSEETLKLHWGRNRLFLSEVGQLLVLDMGREQQLPFELFLKHDDRFWLGFSTTHQSVGANQITMGAAIGIGKDLLSSLGLRWQKKVSSGELTGQMVWAPETQEPLSLGWGWRSPERKLSLDLSVRPYKSILLTKGNLSGDWHLGLNEHGGWALGWRQAGAGLTFAIRNGDLNLGGTARWGNQGIFTWSTSFDRWPYMYLQNDHRNWTLTSYGDSLNITGQFQEFRADGEWLFGKGIGGTLSWPAAKDLTVSLHGNDQMEFGFSTVYHPLSKQYWSVSNYIHSPHGSRKVHLGWGWRPSFEIRQGFTQKTRPSTKESITTNYMTTELAYPFSDGYRLYGSIESGWQPRVGDRLTGWGVGVEQRLSKEATVRLGYRYRPPGLLELTAGERTGPYVEFSMSH
ncbi:MAG: hypothetical protein ACOYD6_02285 [Limnochordia bacterium]|jgi:hypothetical protein